MERRQQLGAGSNEENDENIMIIESPDIGSYVTQEFERIWQQSDTSE